jgi:AcrR family transcriptional regulator
MARDADAARWRPQREAAADSHARLLAAARELLNAPDGLSVDIRDIAQHAGVGVGTVYRRFGDKKGLLAAAIGEEEEALQRDALSGPPPLGPGAPPAERANAFLDALVALTERNLGVLIVTDASSIGRLAIGAYDGWRLHLVMLIRELRPDLDARDAGWHADVLLSTVDPRLYQRQRHQLGFTEHHIAANARRLLAAIAAQRD